MKKIMVLLLNFCVAMAFAAPADATRKESGPYAVRGGLPNFYAKLNAGQEVKIVYLGGSITEQNGWRVLSAAELQKQFPKAPISSVNAAISGTGSNLGTFRLRQDALAQKPDLLFVEFAVNDDAAKVENIRKSMEGIVRQTWRELPGCDICFVYTIRSATYERDFKDGKLPPSASVMEDIAAYYDIPSVNFGYDIARLVKAGKLVMTGKREDMTRISDDECSTASGLPATDDGRIIFSGDGVHPYSATGQVIYNRSLMAALDEISQAGKPGGHLLKDPMQPDCWQNPMTVYLDAPAVKVSGGNTAIAEDDPVFRPFFGRLQQLRKLEPGATIEFKFTGTQVMLYDMHGPGSAEIEVTLDGETRKLRRFDAFCACWRLSLCDIGDNLKDEIHHVKITVLPTRFDKRSILFEQDRPDFDKNPAKYAEYCYYAGNIFILGEMVE